MAAWVIQNLDTKAFVTPPGSERSYTKELRQAQTYSNRPSDLCGNERAVLVDDLLITAIRSQ